jgi:hypothetical protein
MNYQRIYDEFIADRRIKEAGLDGYAEKHHIVPRSLGGSDDASNLIHLEAGDHLFAHVLLAKIHGGNQWGGVWAVAGMVNGTVKGRARNLRHAMRLRKWVDIARKEQAKSQEKEGNHNADLTIYNFANVNTKETYTGTIYNAPFNHRGFSEYKHRKDTVFFSGGWFLLSDFTMEQAQSLKLQQSKNRSESKKGKDRRRFMRTHTIVNVKTGETITGTSLDFPFPHTSLSDHLIRAKRGCIIFIKREWFSLDVIPTLEQARARKKANYERSVSQLTPAKKGDQNRAARKVINLDTGIVFNTVSDAAKSVELNGPGPICNNIAGRSKTAGGYRWAYADIMKEAA